MLFSFELQMVVMEGCGTTIIFLGIRASKDLNLALIWGYPPSVCRHRCILGFQSILLLNLYKNSRQSPVFHEFLACQKLRQDETSQFLSCITGFFKKIFVLLYRCVLEATHFSLFSYFVSHVYTETRIHTLKSLRAQSVYQPHLMTPSRDSCVQQVVNES